MDKTLGDILKASIYGDGREIVNDILSLIIKWYAERGVSMEVRMKGTFKGVK